MTGLFSIFKIFFSPLLEDVLLLFSIFTVNYCKYGKVSSRNIKIFYFKKIEFELK